MKHILSILILVLFLTGAVVIHSFATADTTSPIPCQNAINVKAYGAKGDGTTDDTAAIRNAIAATKTYVKVNGSANSYMGSSDPLCFPAGTYKVTGELAMKGYANVYADGAATLQQSCSSCSIFVFHNGYTMQVRGLTFVGGKHHIALDNQNIDSTTLDIENSEFRSSHDYAIYTEGTTDGHLSARIIVIDSRFVNPKKVMRNVADRTTFRNTVITLSRDNFSSDSAAFWNLGSAGLIFKNVQASVNMGGGNRLSQVRWIDNYGNVFIDQSRFEGSEGGMPLIYQFGSPVRSYPWFGKNVIVRDSRIAAGPDAQPDSAVLVLKEAVPQLVFMKGNSYTATKRIFRNMMNIDEFIAAVRDGMYTTIQPHAFRVQLEDGADLTQAGMPTALLPFVVK